MSEVLERLASALSDSCAARRELGRCGAAIVFLADDLRHERRVTIKVLRPKLSSVVASERFLHEIKHAPPVNEPDPVAEFPGRARYAVHIAP